MKEGRSAGVGTDWPFAENFIHFPEAFKVPLCLLTFDRDLDTRAGGGGGARMWIQDGQGDPAPPPFGGSVVGQMDLKVSVYNLCFKSTPASAPPTLCYEAFTARARWGIPAQNRRRRS